MPIEIQSTGARATINVNGAIGAEITAAEFQDRLNSMAEDVKEIAVNITTRGGSVIDAQAMFGMLRETGKKIITTIIGGAYSAGAVLAQAGDERQMHSNALMMVHGASGGGGSMTADQHRGSLEMIEKANSVMAEMFASRTGRPLAAMMAMLSGKDNWMTAREAKAAGFIDTIIANKSPANAEFVASLPADLLLELVAFVPPAEPVKVDPQQIHKEPEKMADKTTEPTAVAEPKAATPKEIKAACAGCSPAFVLEQIENGATMAEVKDAWIAQLTADRASAEAKAKEESDAKAQAQTELEALKAKPAPKSGVDPVSASQSKSSAGDSTDAVAQWDELVGECVKRGMSKQQAVRECVVSHADVHAAFIQAHNAGVR